MKKAFSSLLVILLLVAAGGWAYVEFFGGEIPILSDYFGSHSDQSAETSEEGDNFGDVVQTVKTAPVRKGIVKVPRVLYGTVVPGKGSLVTVSAPYECKITHILVRKGQEVAKGDPIMEIGPSEDSRLALEQAQNSYDMAKQELDRVKQRLKLKLATNQELIQATEAFRQADLQLQSLSRKGISKPITIKAENPGVVHAINVQEGNLVTLGAPLVNVVSLHNLDVRLGAEPDMVPRLAEGQTLEITSIGIMAGTKAACPIRSIAHTVDLVSHLVDVSASLPKDTDLLLGQPVKGSFSVESKPTLFVPRSAALPEGDHYTVFVIKGGHAHKVIVDIGLQNDQDVEVHGANLHEGDLVAILGNYELEDGMAVKTGGAQ